MIGHMERVHCIALTEGSREAAERGRGGIVGMSFHLRREAQNAVSRLFDLGSPGRCRQAGYNGRRAAAQSFSDGNAAFQSEAGAGQYLPRLLTPAPVGTAEQIVE